MKTNLNNKTIELTKAEMKAAMIYGTDAYKQLQEIRRDYPSFRIVAKAVGKKKADSFKGLTYDFMKKYIAKYDDENRSKMAAFMTLRGTSDEAMAVSADSASYGEIKAWFLQQFPEFAEFQKKREALLTKAAA